MRTVDTPINVGSTELSGCVFEPNAGWPGILFVHGWSGSQDRDQKRSRAISRLGSICMTFDMRGHGRTERERERVSRADNLADICAAYDVLAAHPAVEKESIAVVGSSYGAYLATFLTVLRPVRWLGMRVPALYPDAGWEKPKVDLGRLEMQNYRSRRVQAANNRALRNCLEFEGDVLVVESEHDEYVPRATVASYLASFGTARSLTHRIITGADHGLSTPQSRRSYDELLMRWIREMVQGSR